MNLEKLKKFTKNKKFKQVTLSIGGIILLIGGIFLYKSYAVFKEEETFNVLQGKISDFTKIQGKVEIVPMENTKILDKVPEKNENYIVQEINCNNDLIGTWNEDTWQIELNKTTYKKTTCIVKFEKEQARNNTLSNDEEPKTITKELETSEENKNTSIQPDKMNTTDTMDISE